MPQDDKAAAEKAAADKQAADKAAAEKAGAVGAATSVADAVKRVADAAVAEVKKTDAPSHGPSFTFVGNEQGRFTIQGKGFGANGTVRINGQQARTVEWGDWRIIGRVPDNVKGGQVTVEVVVDEQTKQTGAFTL